MNERAQQRVIGWFLCACLVLVTMAVFAQVRHFDFINLDDSHYIYENPYVQKGLSPESVRWAFTADLAGDSRFADYWRPLSFLSHMLDVELFGLEAGGHHLVNVFFHLVSVILLFLLLSRTTQQPYPSLFVAAVFALHPLQVESVAWIAERKDVLSVCLGLATLLAWVGYIKRQGMFRYIIALLLFALALMTKPMLVTLPCVMLLMDLWPLNRMNNDKGSVEHGSAIGPRVFKRLLFEKIPFFLLSITSVLITTVIHPGRMSDTVSSLTTWGYRFSNAAVSYVVYLRKMVWPNDLAVLYADHAIPGWQTAGATLILLGITVWAIRSLPRRPYVAVGWFWFLGMLLPVIGLFNLGAESMADRFTYMPKIGLLIVVAWGAADFMERYKNSRPVAVILGCGVMVALVAMTTNQLGYWKDSVTLFRRTLEVTKDNWLVRNNLGSALLKRGRLDEAIKNSKEALRINPEYAAAHYNLGSALARSNRLEESLVHLRATIRIQPDHMDAHLNLGTALFQLGEIEESVKYFENALQLKPDHSTTLGNLGLALVELNREDQAIPRLQQSINLEPGKPFAHHVLGRAYEQKGLREQALAAYKNSLQLAIHAGDGNIAKASQRKIKNLTESKSGP